MIKVIIPTPLRKFTAEAKKFEVSNAETVGDSLDQLVSAYPELKQYLFDSQGNIMQYVNIFVESDDIRSLQGKDTRIEDGQTISIVPAIAGGSKAGKLFLSS